jgi:predicted amidohydrolase YtcJ
MKFHSESLRRLVLASAISLLAPGVHAQPIVADAIYSGGPIITMDDARPRAEAVAIKDGRIVAVGRNEEVVKLRGNGTRMIDLAGRTLLPGFFDAHGHVMMGGLQALSANMLPPPDGPNIDIPTIQQTLRAWWAANRKNVDQAKLILGFGYDNSQLKERRHPVREELDAVSTDLPVVIVHQSGHLAVVNSKALEILGYSADTADPTGGVIQRKPGSREPNGVLEETAWFVGIPKLLGNVGPEGMKAFAKAGAELWASYGYTTAQEGRSVPAMARLLKAVADEGGFKIDVVTYPDVLVDRDFIKGGSSRTYTNRFRIAGAKLTIDGSPQGFTAWRDKPYYAPVGNYPPGYSGYHAAKPQDVIAAVEWAFANNIQILTHSNGEAASDLLIASIKSATDKHGQADRRPVLVHGQFQREDQVDSFLKLGVFPSLFPMHTFYWGDWHRDQTVGPEAADNISPTRWYLKRGAMFTSHHDAPVALPDSIRILSATVTRRTRSGDILGPAQRVPVMTALKALTLWAAYQHFEENDKGSIAAGKVADFVILTGDPTAVDPEALDQLKVAETIKSGRSVYAATPAQLKRTHLMDPAGADTRPFTNFLRAVATDRELRMLPEGKRERMRAAMTDARHDTICLSPVLLGLTSSMLSAVPASD